MTSSVGYYNTLPLTIMANPFAVNSMASYLPVNFYGCSTDNYYKSSNSGSSGLNNPQNFVYNSQSATDFYSRLMTAVTQPFKNLQKSRSSGSYSPSNFFGSLSGSSSSSGYNPNALPELGKTSLMKRVPSQTKAKILDAVDRACKKYNVDPKFVISIIYAESGFNPNATSRCGAAGLMQLMPATAKAYGASNPYDIEQNIFAGVKFLKYLLDRYNGNKTLAAAAYNAGPGRVKTQVPNIKETKNYVAKVNKTFASLC